MTTLQIIDAIAPRIPGPDRLECIGRASAVLVLYAIATVMMTTPLTTVLWLISTPAEFALFWPDALDIMASAAAAAVVATPAYALPYMIRMARADESADVATNA